jgi:dimethylaniline monooxygenase (N-oxide forming)
MSQANGYSQMAFSDFPDPIRLRYSTAPEYLQYLHNYAAHFDLERHIKYHCEVNDATLGDKGMWSLKVTQQIGSEHTVLAVEADGLIVATGQNRIPNPVPAGLAGFKGKMIHSSQYDDAFKTEVAEKKLRVLVVGGGESGADLSAELGDLSPNASVWLRRPICIGPRYLVKHDEMKQVQANKTRDFPTNGFLEAATTNRMSAAQNVYAYGLWRRFLWRLPILNSTLSRMCMVSTAPAPFRNDQATFVTKNQRMCEALQAKKIEVLITPSVSTNGRKCTFEMADGTRQDREFDAIVMCTGFRTEFPWIHLPGKEALSWKPRSWFLHCFPERFGHCLFFVGYARPHQGGVPPMAEMVSRYIALLLREERQLPPDYGTQAQQHAVAEREYYSLSPNLHTLVDYNSFLESVARRVGCEPRLPMACVWLFNFHMLTVLLLTLRACCSTWLPLSLGYTLLLWAASAAGFFILDGGLLIKWWFFPHWAVWYRQRGPHANPALLNKTLSRVNLCKTTTVTPGFVLLVLWSIPTYYAQRLISVLLFAPGSVLSALGIGWPKAWGGLLRPKLFALHGCQWRLSDLYLP